MSNENSLQTAQALIQSAILDEEHAERLREETDAAISQLMQAARDKRMAAKIVSDVLGGGSQQTIELPAIQVPVWLGPPKVHQGSSTAPVSPRRTFTDEVTEVVRELERNITITAVERQLASKGIALPNNPRIKISTILTRLAERKILTRRQGLGQPKIATYYVSTEHEDLISQEGLPADAG